MSNFILALDLFALFLGIRFLIIPYMQGFLEGIKVGVYSLMLASMIQDVLVKKGYFSQEERNDFIGNYRWLLDNTLNIIMPVMMDNPLAAMEMWNSCVGYLKDDSFIPDGKGEWILEFTKH